MGILIQDKRLDILSAFIQLESSEHFKDPRNREFTNVCLTLQSLIHYNELTTGNALRELISIGLITRKSGPSTKLNNVLVSTLYFEKQNLSKLKVLFEEEWIFKYINKEFYRFIVE